MGDSNWINGLNLEDIDDELELHKLMDETDDFEERKVIRARLKDVMAQHRAEREERLRRRDEDRENLLRKKVADADEQKRRTLAMYDAMAKSAPAGGNKSLDVNILRTGVPSAQVIPVKETPPVDLIEEAIRQRQRDSDANKKKVLAAFDKAARAGPAGAARLVDFDSVTSEDKKSSKPLSPKDKFQQLDAASSSNVTSKSITPVKVNISSPTAIKEMLLNWVKSKTKTYENINIENFSTSWNNGLAFCALIHHFYPNAFDYLALDPRKRRQNFTLAFQVAEEKAGIAPLLDVEDMVIMKKPDWKCVFTYVQSFYRRFKDGTPVPEEITSNE